MDGIFQHPKKFPKIQKIQRSVSWFLDFSSNIRLIIFKGLLP